MAQKTFRAPSLSLDNKKIAEINNWSFQNASGDEVQIGADGVLGYSDGVSIASVNFKTVIPVKGYEKDIDAAIFEKKTVVVTVPIGGQTWSAEGRMTGATVTSDRRAGTLTGDYTVEGAPRRL